MTAPFHMGQKPLNLLLVGDSLMLQAPQPQTLYLFAPTNSENIAVSNETFVLANASLAADIVAADPEPDIILCGLGINDFIGGASLSTVQGLLGDFIDLCYAAGKFCMVMGLVPAKSFPALAESEWDDTLLYNAWAVGYCRGRGVAFHDPYPLLEDPGTPGDKWHITGRDYWNSSGPDPLHMSVLGYTVWSRAFDALFVQAWNLQKSAALADAAWV